MTGPSTDELEWRREIAARVVRDAGAHACAAFLQRDRLTVETKGTHDWVTNVDLEVERLVRERLNETCPAEPVIGERELQAIISAASKLGKS